MGIMCSFILGAGLLFFLLELRTGFDRKYLYFGLLLICAGVFCGLDVWIAPQSWDYQRVKFQHVVAPFLLPLIFLYVLGLRGSKKPKALLAIHFSIAAVLSVMAWFDLFINNEKGLAAVTDLYFFLFMPYVYLSILLHTGFLMHAWWWAETPHLKRILGMQIPTLALVSLGGVLDMNFMAFRLAPLPIDSYLTIAILFFGLSMFFILSDQFLSLLREREETFDKLKTAYEELESASVWREVGESAGHMNHEIKNYALAIANMAKLALKKNGVDNKTGQILERITVTAGKLTGFSRDVLELSKVRKVHGGEIVDLAAVAEKCAIREFPGGGVSIIVTPGTSPGILGDAERIYQVFFNLYRNAVEAGADKISVRIWSGARILLCVVADNGPGCTHEQFENLFKAFYTTKRGSYGTGLGMSIVHGVLNSHDGHISAYAPRLMGIYESGLQLELVFPIANPTPEKLRPERGLVLAENGLSDTARILGVCRRVGVDPVVIDGLEDYNPIKYPPEKTLLLGVCDTVVDIVRRYPKCRAYVVEETKYGNTVYSLRECWHRRVLSEEFVKTQLERLMEDTGRIERTMIM